MIEQLIFVGVMFTVLMTLGLVVGGLRERSHLRSLDEREHQFASMHLSQLRSFPGCVRGHQPARILVAEVVISSDYLKSFLGGLRNIFGGEVRSFQSLLDRARREALLRIQEQARAEGFNAVCNIRLEAADLGGRDANPKNQLIMAAILASGTAYHADLRSTDTLLTQ